jgi:hypothetical protein
MADPIKGKESLTERLEEDRQKMALQGSEIKKITTFPMYSSPEKTDT